MRIKKIVYLFILFTSLFFILLLAQFLTTNEKQTLHHYLPSSVDVALKINNKKLLHRLGFDFLFFIDDLPIKEKPTASSLPPPTGIDAQQEIILYMDYYKDIQFIGALVHVHNPTHFRSFVEDQENMIGATNNGVGAMSIVPKNADSAFLTYMQLYLEDATIKNENRTKTRIGLANSHPKSILHAFIEGSPIGLVQDLTLEGFLDKNTLKITGKGKKNPTIDLIQSPKHFVYEASKPNALEIKAGKLADTVKGFIQTVLFENDYDFPEIASQHVFFYGFDLTQVNEKTILLPKFDGVIHFEETLPAAFLENYPKGPFDQNNPKTVSVGPVNYFIQPLSSTELYIGKADNPRFVYYTPENYLSLEGNLETLLILEGDNFFAQVAAALPPVRNSRKFLQSVENFFLSTNFLEDGEVEIESILSFDENTVASLEIIKFLLRF